jgi:stalled ribosome rescue protein Dom34
VWIDHTQAIFVRLGPGEPEISSLRSDAPIGTRASAAAGETKEQAESRLARRRRQQLREFYGQVIETVADAARIVVLGPGTAKLELRQLISDEYPAVAKRLEQVRPCERVAQRQLIERVRELLAAPRPTPPRARGRKEVAPA